MATLKVTAEYRLSQWMKVIQDRQNSGQNIKEFCQATGISRHAYYYWQRKLRKVACSQLAKPEESAGTIPGGWVQFATVSPMNSSLKIEVGGCHISVNNETDPDLLKKVCRILRVL